MKQLIEDHFRELLLCSMALIFAMIAVWTIKHDATEAFKWSSAAVTTLLGALLMLMRGPSTEAPPKAKSDVGQEEKK